MNICIGKAGRNELHFDFNARLHSHHSPVMATGFLFHMTLAIQVTRGGLGLTGEVHLLSYWQAMFN